MRIIKQVLWNKDSSARMYNEWYIKAPHYRPFVKRNHRGPGGHIKTSFCYSTVIGGSRVVSHFLTHIKTKYQIHTKKQTITMPCLATIKRDWRSFSLHKNKHRSIRTIFWPILQGFIRCAWIWQTCYYAIISIHKNVVFGSASAVMK